MRAETASRIALNGVGYLANASKQATVASGGEEFVVRDTTTNEEVLRGKLTSAAQVSSGNGTKTIADFSALRRKGSYKLSIPGIGDSAKFRIDEDVHNWPLYCSLRGMYLWRCGCKVTGELRGDQFQHAACHTEDAYLDYVGGRSGERIDGSGGWHDAGDYNKYTVNGAFTVGMMLQAWEHFRDRLSPLKLDIPESGNQVPDFLDEVRWELDWLIKMQAADGRVYHKLSTLKFDGFILPENETDRRYFSPWGSAATADFAAVMAQAGRVFRKVDDSFADHCLVAAKKSYEFLKAHPEDHRPDLSAFSTGPYDSPDPDDRLWAAAELWETTGEPNYLRDCEQCISKILTADGEKAGAVDVDWDWGNLRNLGLFTYLLSARPERNPTIVSRIRHDQLQAADTMVEAAGRQAYGRPLDSKYYWGCNGTVARQAMNLNVAYRLTGDERYRATMLDAINYLFGRNPFGRSFVTGLGNKPPMFPHDRRSGGDKVVAPWPGYLVGGAWPTATDWFDDQENYQTNEIAINWNGALIYALSAFVEPQSFDASIKAACSESRDGAKGEQ